MLKFIAYYCSADVVATTDAVEACKGVNVAVMVGGFPRKEGMERKDVMSKNVSIYKAQASALEHHAAPDCKVRKLSFNCNMFSQPDFHTAYRKLTCLSWCPIGAGFGCC